MVIIFNRKRISICHPDEETLSQMFAYAETSCNFLIYTKFFKTIINFVKSDFIMFQS
jgi:hypothetical protein